MFPLNEDDSIESMLEPFRLILQKPVRFISQVTNRNGLFVKVTTNGAQTFITLKNKDQFIVCHFGPGCVLMQEEEHDA